MCEVRLGNCSVARLQRQMTSNRAGKAIRVFEADFRKPDASASKKNRVTPGITTVATNGSSRAARMCFHASIGSFVIGP